MRARARVRSASARASRLRLRRQLCPSATACAAGLLDDRRRLGRSFAVGASAFGGGVSLDRPQEVGERHVRAARSSWLRPRSRG